MAVIKDIVDLCIKLRNENRDGKISAALSEIQSLTLALQSEQAAIVDQNADLVAENYELKRELLAREKEHAEAMKGLQEQHSADTARLSAANTEDLSELPEMEQKVLVLCLNPMGRSQSEIERCLQLLASEVRYHLENLVKRDFIEIPAFRMDGGGVRYSITAKGRAHCAEKGLIF